MQLSRLLHAHEVILLEVRFIARQAAADGDEVTDDLLVSEVRRTNEHLVDEPLVRASTGLA